MDINFYLKSKESKTRTPINVFVGAPQFKRFNVSSKLYIIPSAWDFKKQKSKNNADLNTRLENISKHLEKSYYEALAASKENLGHIVRESLEKYLNQGKSEFSDIEQHITEFKEIKTSINGIGTMKIYNTAFSHAKAFCAKKGIPFSFDSFTLNFFERYFAWLISPDGQDLVNSSATNYIKFLKRFIKWTAKNGYHKNLAVTEYKLKDYEGDAIALSEDELTRIQDKDLSDYPGVEKARDILCFECYTGLRFSDVESLDQEDIKADHIIKYAVKTKQKITIPLNDYSRAILAKYDNKLPVISDQKTRDHLKTLGKLCDINELESISRQKGANMVTETLPRYELLGTHTGRRTFITLSLEKGMAHEAVMKITGIKSYKTLKRYIKMTEKVLHIEMNRAWNKTKVVEFKAQ